MLSAATERAGIYLAYHLLFQLVTQVASFWRGTYPFSGFCLRGSDIVKKSSKLLVCAAGLLIGMASSPTVWAEERGDWSDVSAADAQDVIDLTSLETEARKVYAKYARESVSIAKRGASAMSDAVQEATPQIQRLLQSGNYQRARALAGQTIRKIERFSDKSRGAIRESSTEGVDALMRFEGLVRPQVLRGLIGDLLNLAHRNADYVKSVELRSVDAIHNLFPQVQKVPDRLRKAPSRR